MKTRHRAFSLTELLMAMAFFSTLLVVAMMILHWALRGSQAQEADTRAAFLAQGKMEEIFAASNPEAGSGHIGEYNWKSTITPLPGDFLDVAVAISGPRGCDFTLKSQRRLAHRELLYSGADHQLVSSSEDYREHQSVPGGTPGSYSLARDGETLAYIDSHEGKPQIFTRKLNDKEGKMLFEHPAGAAEPAWSPDGRQIAFTAQDNGYSQIFVYDLKSGLFENRSNSGHHDGSPAWTVDGKGLLFCRDGSNIILLGKDGEVPLVDDTSGWNTAPSLSPDGKTLLFMSNRDGNPEIYLKDLSNQRLLRLTNNPAYETNPHFSADCKRILFQSDREDDHLPRIYSMNPDGSQVENLTPGQAVSQGIWLP